MSLSSTPSSAPPPPFAFANESAEFGDRWGQEVAKRTFDGMTKLIPPENVLHYNHGTRWSIQTTQGKESPGEFHLTSAEYIFSNEEILDADLAALVRHTDEIAQRLVSASSVGMKEKLSEAAESVGNVVSSNKMRTDPGGTFLEMLQKVEFGVKENGEVSLPTFVDCPPEFLAQLHLLEATDPKFRAEAEGIKAEKSAQALRREAERKAKFAKRT